MYDSKVGQHLKIQEKAKAFNEKRMTSHWPNNIKLGGKTPQLANPMPTHINTLPDPQLVHKD